MLIDDLIVTNGHCVNTRGQVILGTWTLIRADNIETCIKWCKEYTLRVVTGCLYNARAKSCNLLKEDVAFGNGAEEDVNCIIWERKRPEGKFLLIICQKN